MQNKEEPDSSKFYSNSLISPALMAVGVFIWESVMPDSKHLATIAFAFLVFLYVFWDFRKNIENENKFFGFKFPRSSHILCLLTGLAMMAIAYIATDFFNQEKINKYKEDITMKRDSIIDFQFKLDSLQKIMDSTKKENKETNITAPSRQVKKQQKDVSIDEISSENEEQLGHSNNEENEAIKDEPQPVEEVKKEEFLFEFVDISRRNREYFYIDDSMYYFDEMRRANVYLPTGNYTLKFPDRKDSFPIFLPDSSQSILLKEKPVNPARTYLKN